MNAKTPLIAAVFALLAGAASAGDLVNVPNERSVLTRSEVQAELLRARAAGELISSGDSYGLQWAHVQTPRAPQLPRMGTERREQSQRRAVPAFNELYIGG